MAGDGGSMGRDATRQNALVNWKQRESRASKLEATRQTRVRDFPLHSASNIALSTLHLHTTLQFLPSQTCITKSELCPPPFLESALGVLLLRQVRCSRQTQRDSASELTLRVQRGHRQYRLAQSVDSQSTSRVTRTRVPSSRSLPMPTMKTKRSWMSSSNQQQRRRVYRREQPRRTASLSLVGRRHQLHLPRTSGCRRPRSGCCKMESVTKRRQLRPRRRDIVMHQRRWQSHRGIDCWPAGSPRGRPRHRSRLPTRMYTTKRGSSSHGAPILGLSSVATVRERSFPNLCRARLNPRRQDVCTSLGRREQGRARS